MVAGWQGWANLSRPGGVLLTVQELSNPRPHRSRPLSFLVYLGPSLSFFLALRDPHSSSLDFRYEEFRDNRSCCRRPETLRKIRWRRRCLLVYPSLSSTYCGKTNQTFLTRNTAGSTDVWSIDFLPHSDGWLSFPFAAKSNTVYYRWRNILWRQNEGKQKNRDIFNRLNNLEWIKCWECCLEI